MAEETAPILKKSFTVKDAYLSDIELFNKLKLEKGFTQASFFKDILKKYTTESLILNNDYDKIFNENLVLLEENKRLLLEIEVIKEVPVHIPLDSVLLNIPCDSVLYTPSLQTAKLIRKLRLYIKNKKDFEVITNHENFVNDLCDKSINKFIKYHYEELI